MKQYLLYICAILLAACTDEVAPPKAPQPAGAMCFTVEAGETRVKDDMYRATFQNGDKVGCVIAVKENGAWAFKTRSQWHYQDGALIPDSVWKTVTTTQQIDHGTWTETKSETKTGYFPIIAVDPTDEDYIMLDPARDATKGYFQLTKANTEYGFFFVYPLLTDDIMMGRVKDNKVATRDGGLLWSDLPFVLYEAGLDRTLFSLNNSASIYSNLHRFVTVGPFDSQNVQQSNTSFYHYDWHHYPAFVCLNQNDTQNSPDRNNDETRGWLRRIMFSNWMWTRAVADTRDASQPITQTTAVHTYPLVFHKKMGAIEIISQDPLTNVSIDATNTNGLTSGIELNMETGALTNYVHSEHDWLNTTWQSKACVMHNSVGSYVYRPRNWVTKRADNLYHQRLILPPQPFQSATMTFTLFGIQHTIAIGQNIKKIEENKLYIIRLDRQGDPSFIIRNWQDDQKDILLDLS